jgi:hypothetical protein
MAGLLSDIAKGEGGVFGVIIFLSLAFISSVIIGNILWYLFAAGANSFGVTIPLVAGPLFVIMFWGLMAFAGVAGITAIYKSESVAMRISTLAAVMLLIVALYFLALKAPTVFPTEFQGAILQMKTTTMSLISP